jgi:hypothetical protein
MKKLLISIYSKIIYYLQKWDGLWSVPLGFFSFFFVGLTLSYFFGVTVGSYDMAFIQPLFLAGTIVIGATNMAVLGLYFTFRTIHRYIYGKTVAGSIVNNSKDDFNSSHPIFKICVSIFLFCFFVVSILWVYLKLV